MHAHAHGGTGSVSKAATYMAALLHHSHGKQEGRRAVGFLALVRNVCILGDIIKSTK